MSSPNMDYCKFENTARAVAQCNAAMREARGLAELLANVSEYEFEGFQALLRNVREFSDWADALGADEGFESLSLADFKEVSTPSGEGCIVDEDGNVSDAGFHAEILGEDL